MILRPAVGSKHIFPIAIDGSTSIEVATMTPSRRIAIAGLLLLGSPFAARSDADVVLYGTTITNGSLFTVDIDTAVATTLGPFVPNAQIEGLAFNPATGNFFGVDNSNHTFVEVSSDPVGWSLVQTLPLGTYTNLARNSVTGIYYTHVSTTNVLSTVDPLTGAVTPVGASSGVPVQSLAFDSTGRVFGIGDIPAPGGEALYEFNVATGAVLSSVAITSGLSNPRFDGSLAIHPSTGYFYTMSTLDGLLFRIEPASGVANFIGFTGLRNVRSLEFALIVPEPSAILLAITGGIAMSIARNSRKLRN
jgi:hypothetical protein